MNNLKLLLYVFFFLLAVACHPGRSYVKEIEVAYTMIEEHPDTALYVLQKIPDPQNMSEKDYTTYQLLLTYHQARSNERLGNDTLSEQHYLAALAEAEKAEDYGFTGLVYTKLSELYIRNGEYQKAFDMQRKAHSNYLLASNQKKDAMWYWFIIPTLLILICLFMLYRYHAQYTMITKITEKQKKQLAAAHKTIADQKLELTSLKKDLKIIMEQKYNTSEIVQKIRNFNNLTPLSKEKPTLSEKEWNDYLTILEENYGFVSSLRKAYPRLTDIDIRICALIKSKVSTLHIGSIMNMIPDTLNKRIQRIKNEKMSLSGSNTPLEVVLHEL